MNRQTLHSGNTTSSRLSRLSFQIKNRENTPGLWRLVLPRPSNASAKLWIADGALCPVDSPVSVKKEWVLTKESFDVFLARLDADRDRAAEKYEVIRVKLLKYFLWWGVVAPEEGADEVINRVARKILEGENIFNLNGFIYGVAKLVAAELIKKQTRNQQISEDEHEIEGPVADEEDPEMTERRTCLDNCLQRLSDQSRVIIIEYYRFEKKDKSKHRKELAATQGVTVNALRISAHRIRLNLEACVRECLSKCA